MWVATGTTVLMQVCSTAISTTHPATRTTTTALVPADFGTPRPAKVLTGSFRDVLKGGNSS